MTSEGCYVGVSDSVYRHASSLTGRGFQSRTIAILGSAAETMRLTRNRDPSAFTSYSYAEKFKRSGMRQLAWPRRRAGPTCGSRSSSVHPRSRQTERRKSVTCGRRRPRRRRRPSCRRPNPPASSSCALATTCPLPTKQELSRRCRASTTFHLSPTSARKPRCRFSERP